MKAAVFDPMTLSDLAEHPRVVEAQRQASQAETDRARAHAAGAAAIATLAAAEDAAARGDRDEKRLQQARALEQAARSEVAIAERRVVLRQEGVCNARVAAAADTHAALLPLRDAAIRAMVTNLERAQEDCRRAAAIEDRIKQLLPVGPYGGDPAHAIDPLAWRREFNVGGRLDTFKETCGLYAEPRPQPVPSARSAVRLREPVSMASPIADAHGCAGYNAGDVVGFEPAIARDLVRRGLADPVSPS